MLEKAHRHHSAAGATRSYTNHQLGPKASDLRKAIPRPGSTQFHARCPPSIRTCRFPEPPRKTTNSHTTTPANLCAHYVHASTNTLRCIGPAHKHTRPDKPLQSRTTITLSTPTPIPTTPPRPQNQRPSTHNRSPSHTNTASPSLYQPNPTKFSRLSNPPTTIATPRGQTPSEVPIGGPRIMLRVDLALCRRVAKLGGEVGGCHKPRSKPSLETLTLPPAQRSGGDISFHLLRCQTQNRCGRRAGTERHPRFAAFRRRAWDDGDAPWPCPCGAWRNPKQNSASAPSSVLRPPSPAPR